MSQRPRTLWTIPGSENMTYREMEAYAATLPGEPDYKEVVLAVGNDLPRPLRNQNQLEIVREDHPGVVFYVRGSELDDITVPPNTFYRVGTGKASTLRSGDHVRFLQRQHGPRVTFSIGPDGPWSEEVPTA